MRSDVAVATLPSISRRTSARMSQILESISFVSCAADAITKVTTIALHISARFRVIGMAPIGSIALIATHHGFIGLIENGAEKAIG